MQMKSQSKPQKPFVLLKEEAEDTIFNAVSEAANAIPFCTIEDILTNLLHQVRAKADKERETLRDAYEKQMAEYLKAEKEGEECKKQ